MIAKRNRTLSVSGKDVVARGQENRGDVNHGGRIGDTDKEKNEENFIDRFTDPDK